ncbi:cupin domain-containing protein [Nitrosomonas sp. HPC101]|nr:cupin domain-containing protein [Nitrosomonas sp. HPC101]MXS85472.1 cupin domain-containing protein [Nitrosomonas sp. HPC101]
MMLKFKGELLAALLGVNVLLAVPPASAQEVGEKVTLNFQQAIPNIPGKSLIVVEVEYAPGAASVPHHHAQSAFIYAYVLKGAIESQVNDEEARIYQAGQSWSEAPGALHSISRNASQTEPAKLLAVFVVDSSDKTLTQPVK